MQRDPGPALWVEWEPTLGLLRADLLQRIGKPLRSAHPSGAAQQSQVAVTQASAGLLGVLKYDRCSPRYRRGGGDRGSGGTKKSLGSSLDSKPTFWSFLGNWFRTRM